MQALAEKVPPQVARHAVRMPPVGPRQAQAVNGSGETDFPPSAAWEVGVAGSGGMPRGVPKGSSGQGRSGWGGEGQPAAQLSHLEVCLCPG